MPKRPVKPESVLNREDEWRSLVRVWTSDRPELAIVLGRRRVGKSFTLVPFARAVNGIYYQATRQTEAEQLRALSGIVGDRFEDAALRAGVGFPDWAALFRYVVNAAAGEPFLIVIDEFPYLESAAQALPSILQSLIDHDFQKSRVKLVLSGSHVTAMTRLERADQPLYARRTARLVFSPFSYLDAAAFVPAYSAVDRMRTYGIAGGVPGHLALLDPEESLATNVAAQLLDSSSRLFDEAQHMLDAFLSDAEVHYSIIEAIAAGERTWGGITNRVGKGSGSLSRPMSWLMDMGMVRRDVPISVGRPKRSKRSLYTITDPYVAFWHRFLSPLIQAGVAGTADPHTIWSRDIEPALDDYMGWVFEEVCRSAMRLRPELVPFDPLRTGSWWSTDSRDQVDVVVQSGDGDLLVGECKWGRVGENDFHTLRRRAELVTAELDGISRVHYALFSGRSTVDEAVRDRAARGELLLFGAEDLFV